MPNILIKCSDVALAFGVKFTDGLETAGQLQPRNCRLTD
jgi:hypothetical protein